jgi:putative ABC transport system ATP-binding protein
VGVTKTYTTGGRRVEALRGVDLVVEEPGFYAIMGQSGSGKSTLLHLLGVLDRPDAGEIAIAGLPVEALGERDATVFRRRQVGVVFQQFNLLPTVTARENIELPGVLAGESGRWLTQRSAELMERLGVSDRASHRPDALSGGEQQRVAIARALLFSPPVVLADEPTGNLDSASAAKLWSVLAELASGPNATTVVMVTHEPAAAVNCRRVFVLSDGRVTGVIDTEGLDAGGVAARYQQLVRTA